MKTFRWWDSDLSEEYGENIEARSFKDAANKALWVFMGAIGKKFEYDIQMTIKDMTSNEMREFDIHAVFDTPTITINGTVEREW